MVIPSPFSPLGILEYFNLKRMAAIVTIAKANPAPELNPKTVDSPNVYPRSAINNDAPRMEQFTAISGRKIPNELYKAGLNLSRKIGRAHV